MLKGCKVMLHPTPEQEQKLWQSAGVSRWAYNYGLAMQMEHFKQTGKKLNEGDIRKEITRLKQTEGYEWLKGVSAQIPKQAIKDLDCAYKRFFETQKVGPKHTPNKINKANRQGRKLTTYDLNGHPRFKQKKRSKPKFYQRYDKLKFKNGKANLEKIGWVSLAEPDRIPEGKYSNPRISHDGINWWLSVGVEVKKEVLDTPKTAGVGADLGVKRVAVISSGEKIKNINKTAIVRKLNKKLKRLQRRASRQYEKRKGGENRYEKTSNLLKLERRILKVHKRLTNLRTNHIHQITTKLVKANPEFVVIEDLNISGMMKNKHLSRAVQEQKLYELRRQLEYKCDWHGVPLLLAERWYPSSKLCSDCDMKKEDLKLSDRTFCCDSCGLEMDRDLNASINLRNLGYRKLAS